MFLSPILILALLFSSCDDGEKAPSVTLKLTSETITATGMTGGETGDVKTTGAPDEVTGESVVKESIASSSLTVTVGASGENSKVEGTITLAEGKTLADVKDLTTLVFKNVKIGQNETAYDMTLTGTAYTGSGDWTITGITFAAAAPAEKVTVNLETGNTEVPVEGQGEGKTAIEALTTGSSITLTADNLSSKDVVESVEGLTITFTEAKKASIAGTLTLASGVEATETTLVFDQGSINITGTGADTVGTIESVTLTGESGSEGESWTLSKITVNAAAKEPESLDITTIKYSSGSNVTTTGTYEYASGGSLELQGSGFTPACEGKLTVTVAADKACTIAAEGFKIPATAKESLSTTGLTWSGNGTLDSQTITKVVIKGTYTEDGEGTLTISSLEINKQV